MYLLDTHTLLWALFKEDFLSVNARKVILDDNDIFVSIVSLWEIAMVLVNKWVDKTKRVALERKF